MTGKAHGSVPQLLSDHLALWLGAWPPAASWHVVGSRRRVEPGWDGRIHPGIGVADPGTGAVLSLPPATAERVLSRAERGDCQSVLPRLPELLGLPGRRTYRAVFRWTTAPAPLTEIGRWVSAADDRVPEWLRPFGGDVLVATDADGAHLAGVGIKRHDAAGHELSVVTASASRGRGLARALIAQAARRVLDEGAIPTYLHDVTNTASARAAEAAGFPDVGWTSFGISEVPRSGRSRQIDGEVARSPALTTSFEGTRGERVDHHL